MFPDLLFLDKKDEKNLHYIVGHIENGQLNGYGRDTIVNNGVSLSSIGYFKNGKLEGTGKKVIDGKINEFGFYKDEELINLEEFKAKAHQKIIPEIEEERYVFVDSILYYTSDDPDNLNGLALLECNKFKVFFISGQNRIIEGETTYLKYLNYENNKPVGVEIRVLTTKEKGSNIDSYFRIDDTITYALVNYPDWGYKLLEWENIDIRQGTELLSSGSIEISSSVKIKLPLSIKTLEADVFVSTLKHFFVEAFYEGTIENFKKIKEGKDETVVTEDWYGYYYHNSERYDSYNKHTSWAHGSRFLLIHCTDGDIGPTDETYW